MIRVTIEMVPMGNERLKRTMGTIEIDNQVATTLVDPRRGDYRGVLSRVATRSEFRNFPWKTVYIKNYNRAGRNVYHLLYEILKEALGK